MLKSSSHIRVSEEDQFPIKKLSSEASTSYTPLHEAAIAGKDATIEVLLLAEADRFCKDPKHGNTALHEAAWRGYSRCVKLLCTFSNMPRFNNKKFGRKTKDVKHLEDDWRNEMYLNTPNAGGFSPLHLAAQNGHNQSCREILLAGANPNVKNNYGDAPLHTSCRYGHAGATRILISAKCDPLCVNLNYDTPLHIACAMGRRKLTRILYEVCGTSALLVRNAQGETARDIVLRKNLKPIIEILNTTPIRTTTTSISDDVDGQPLRHETTCRSSSGSNRNPNSGSDKIKSKKKPNQHMNHSKQMNGKDRQHVVGDPKVWSPYGCHYFPDPRTFPPPNLETLPKDPLKYGEQYYLDLAGHIHKGPIGIGNTCYCGPFFNHIEQQINQNKKSFKKYVLNATGNCKDGKVQEIAQKTDDKIKKIARSIMAEQSQEKRWPLRNNPLRATVVPMSKDLLREELNNNTLSRCRSLEFLEDKKLTNNKLNRITTNSLYRSHDLLNDDTKQHRAIIHHDMITHSKSSSSAVHSTNTNETSSRRIHTNVNVQQNNKFHPLDFREKYDNHSTLTDVESLEDFTSKTKELIQVKRAARQKLKEKTLQELRERQTIEKYPSNFPSNSHHTEPTSSLDDYPLGKLNRSPYRYPNDFDNISAEMKNITELLGASIIEPLESAPSTSSSFSTFTNKFPKLSDFRDNGHDQNGGFSSKSANDNPISESFESHHLNGNNNEMNLINSNGFFQNTCFENQSSSSCNTLKSVELAKTENGDDDDDGDS